MPATTEQHNIVYRVLGAVQAATANRQVGRSMLNLRRIGSQLQAGMQGMAGLMIGFAGSLVAVGLALRRTVTAYSEYTQAQARMRTLMSLSVENYRLHARLAGDLSERVGIDLGYSLVEANDAMTTLLETGIGTHASMRIFQTGMALARVGMMETADASQFLVDSINLFRNEMIGPDGASMELQRFANLTAGRLAISAARSSTSIDQMRQSFRYAATTMQGFHQTSTETMAAIAGLSSIGIRGTTAGTSMRQFMLQLRDPSQRVRDRLTELTGSAEAWTQIAYDAEGRSRPFVDSLQQLFRVFSQLNTEQERAELAAMMFGSRSINVGLSVGEWNMAAEQMVTLTRELSDETQVLTGFQRAQQQSMMSFGMQMNQLKEGATDLAIAFGEILFGAMDTTGEGFGTYVRDLARAIRLLGRTDREAREEFAQLSPEIRETASNTRELFRNVAGLLRALWKMGVWMARFTADHPMLVASILAVRLAFGGTLPAVNGLLTGMQMLGRQSLMWGQGAAVPVANGAQIMRGALTLLAVDGVGRLTRAAQDNLVELMGMRGELDEIRRTTIASYQEAARGIPIIGGLASQYMELLGAMQAAYRAAQEVSRRRAAAHQRTIGASALQRTEEYASRNRERLQAQGMSEDEIQRYAASVTERTAIQEMAASLMGAGVEGEGAIRSRLGAEGMSAERINELAASISRAQRTIGDVATAEQTIAGVARRNWLGMVDFEGSVDDSVRQLNEFGTAIQQINDMATSLQLGLNGPAPVPGQEMTMAEDAYVRHGGLMGVSSGDLVVSRNHLADAITANRGAMAGPAIGMPSHQTMAGPTPSASTGGGGELSVTVPVVIDGREVARAAGRAQIRQLERGGARLRPGQRRSLRETGFNRAV